MLSGKTQRDNVNYINTTYKDILRFPIDVIKVKNYDTGDQKTGKYHWQYTATLKPTGNSKISENISTNSLEELDRRLAKKLVVEGEKNMSLYENIKSNLKESDNSMKDKFIEFKRQVHSDFEQFEEDMMNDDTDIFSGTEDSYANEMIWEHLSDTVYYLLEDKFDTDRIYDLTNVFTSKLIDAYNENKLDDEIGRVFATYMHGLNESEETSIKLTKDNKDTLEIGDILADSTNQYKITNIIKTPKSMAITVRDTKENRPIFADPISNWYGTKIIKGKKEIKEAENNNVAYVICYGTLEIWPDRDSAREYYEEGIAMSDGAEQQRYGNIAFALYKGSNFGDDEGPEMVTKIVDKNPDGSTKTERVNCGKMTHEQAFEYINKLAGLHESEDTCIYTCNDCGNEFECNQIFNKDKEGNPICPKCSSRNIIKEE